MLRDISLVDSNLVTHTEFTEAIWFDILDELRNLCHAWWPAGLFNDGIPTAADVEYLRSDLMSCIHAAFGSTAVETPLVAIEEEEQPCNQLDGWALIEFAAVPLAFINLSERLYRLAARFCSEDARRHELTNISLRRISFFCEF